MKQIDWNEASRQGLVERINTEILHPLGLAMVRTVEDGASPGLLVADDGQWVYAQGTPGILPTVTAERDQLAAANEAMSKDVALLQAVLAGIASGVLVVMAKMDPTTRAYLEDRAALEAALCAFYLVPPRPSATPL